MLETRQLILRDLIDRGVMSDADLAPAHAHAAKMQVTTLQALVATGTISHRDLALARARVSEHPFVDLDRYHIDPDNAALLPGALARRATAFPLFVIDGVATLGVIDPHDIQSIEAIRQATHHEIETVVCDEQALLDLIENAYGSLEAPSAAGEDRPAAEHTDEQAPDADESPITSLIADAASSGASSLHIDPGPDATIIRTRTNGAVRPVTQPTPATHADAIASLRRLAALDTPRSPAVQDAELTLETGAGRLRASLTIAPTSTGESAVIRFADTPRAPRPLDELGMPREVLSFLRASLTHDAGLMLIAGGLASGRTTTAFSAAAQLVAEGRVTVTVEEHLEAELAGARQILVDAASGMTTVAAVRVAERLDADAILIGEIRDPESARAAVRAAAAGLLVIAPIDADPPGAARDRLIRLGIPPAAADDCLLGAIAQISIPPADPSADPVVLFAAEHPGEPADTAAALADHARAEVAAGRLPEPAAASLESRLNPAAPPPASRRLSA